jgi:hypothetical protein
MTHEELLAHHNEHVRTTVGTPKYAEIIFCPTCQELDRIRVAQMVVRTREVDEARTQERERMASRPKSDDKDWVPVVLMFLFVLFVIVMAATGNLSDGTIDAIVCSGRAGC